VTLRPKEPFALVDRKLAQQFGLRENELKSAFEAAVANSSALSYVQLGRPETISISSEGAVRELHEYLNDLREPPT
jgi:hypothetical protein